MKTQVKKIDKHKRELSVEVGSEAVNKKFDDIYAQIGKEAKVSGFRPGKAPRDVLEKHYKDLAAQQVIKELIPEAYSEAIKSESLDVLNCLEVNDVKLDNATLTFKAVLELKPEINFKKEYKGIKIKYKDIEIPEDEISRTIDSLKESHKSQGLDANFARSLGYPDMENLTEIVRMQLYLQKENARHAKIEEDIVNYLLENADFQTPLSLIEQQLQELVERQKVELALRGMPKDKIEDEDKTLRDRLKTVAEKQVQTYLVLEGIAKKENMPLDKDVSHKVMEFLLREATWEKTS